MMKKVMLGLIAAAVMSSCIKREEVTTTDQATNLGTGTITGTVWAKTDYMGDTLSNGSAGTIAFNTKGVSPIAGATVIASYNTSDLDADGVNSEDLTVIGVTDANGVYTLEIPATGEGTYVDVYVDYTGNMSVKHNCTTMGYDNSGTATFASTSHEFALDYNYATTVFDGQTYNRANWLEECDDALNTCY